MVEKTDVLEVDQRSRGFSRPGNCKYKYIGLCYNGISMKGEEFSVAGNLEGNCGFMEN